MLSLRGSFVTFISVIVQTSFLHPERFVMQRLFFSISHLLSFVCFEKRNCIMYLLGSWNKSLRNLSDNCDVWILCAALQPGCILVSVSPFGISISLNFLEEACREISCNRKIYPIPQQTSDWRMEGLDAGTLNSNPLAFVCFLKCWLHNTHLYSLTTLCSPSYLRIRTWAHVCLIWICFSGKMKEVRDSAIPHDAHMPCLMSLS